MLSFWTGRFQKAVRHSYMVGVDHVSTRANPRCFRKVTRAGMSCNFRSRRWAIDKINELESLSAGFLLRQEASRAMVDI